MSTERKHRSVVQPFHEEKLIGAPRWLSNAVAYETIMGSIAYGVSNDTSDTDVSGFCIPPKEQILPRPAARTPTRRVAPAAGVASRSPRPANIVLSAKSTTNGGGVVGSLVERLTERRAVTPPSFLKNNIHYETIMGSVAYGVSGDTSDMDVYGFAIPPKHVVFPHLAGEIPGFGTPGPRFEQYQEHHIQDPDGKKGSEGQAQTYDLAIFSIVKFFQLCLENNPNMIDSLYTPQRCVLHITRVGQMVRDNRRMFLHKGAFHKFRGYAYSQLHKADIKTPQPSSKRGKTVQEHGWDLKFGYHVVRLLDEAEQILTTGDIDLERSKELLKAIRRGEWSLEQTKDYFTRREKELEQAYAESKLPHKPDEAKIKELLLTCLEEHYGSLEGAVVTEEAAVRALRQIREILDRPDVAAAVPSGASDVRLHCDGVVGGGGKARQHTARQEQRDGGVDHRR